MFIIENPLVTVQDIQEFEANFRITLYEDYKTKYLPKPLIYQG